VLAALDTALAFLRESLIPHAQAEDAVLYPRVEQVMQAPRATATMSRDHAEVVRLTADLERVGDSLQGAPDPERHRELQRILYGLYGIIRLHFAKEEELYLPLLDAGLGSAEAAEMFRAMHESAHRSGSADHEPAHH
jgi:iron-sulfur cluster repair protein YtfE (RIC family)